MNPDHDSLFLRFEQLARILREAAGTAQAKCLPDLAYPLFDAEKLLKLIRAEVLK